MEIKKVFLIINWKPKLLIILCNKDMPIFSLLPLNIIIWTQFKDPSYQVSSLFTSKQHWPAATTALSALIQHGITVTCLLGELPVVASFARNIQLAQRPWLQLQRSDLKWRCDNSARVGSCYVIRRRS
jgi:hypothetical protein